MALKVTLDDKDERKGKKKKVSMVFVRSEDNLRTTLDIMKMKVKKNCLQYLKQYSTMRKGVGKLSKTIFLNPL